MIVRNISLIYKKEVRSYFSSFIAYAVIAIFLVITGFMFNNIVDYYSLLSFKAQANPMLAKQYNLLNITETVVRPMFGQMSMVMLLMMPLLSMKLLADEKKSGTMELILTYPINDSEVVLGKFFACLTVFAAMLLATVTYPVLLMAYGQPELAPIITGYFGLFLMGAAFISLGLFTSSVTENQIVAASLALGLLFMFYLMSMSVAYVSPDLGRVISYLSINDHFESLAKGVLDTEDIIYYLCFITVFLFLTLRSIETHRWRG